MSFRANADAMILMKSAGANPDLWYATIDGKSGFVSNRFLRESRILVKDPQHIIPLEVRRKESEEVLPDRVQQSHEVVEGTTIYSGEVTTDNSQYDSTTLPPASSEQSTPAIFNQDYADALADQSPDNRHVLNENSDQQVTESPPIDYDYGKSTTEPPINTTPDQIAADYADALGPDQTALKNKNSQEHLNPLRNAEDLPVIEPLPTPQSIASGEASMAAQAPENIDLLPQPLPPDSLQNVDYDVENNVSKEAINSAEQQNRDYKENYDKQQLKQQPDYDDAFAQDYRQDYHAAENGQVQEPTTQTIPAILPEDAMSPSAEIIEPLPVAETATKATIEETTPVTVTETSSQEQTQETMPSSIPQTPVDYILGNLEGNQVTSAPEIIPLINVGENQENQNPDYYAQPAQYADVTTETIPAANTAEDYLIESTATPNESTESVSEPLATEATEIVDDQVSTYDGPTTESSVDDYRRNADDGIDDAPYIREDDEDHSLFSGILTTLANMWWPTITENIEPDVDQTENKVDYQSWYSFIYYLTNTFHSQEETKALFASPGKCK